MIKIKKLAQRSLEENRYYYGVVIAEIVGFKGWTQLKAHEWVKDTWNIESTASLNTAEFEMLMDSIRAHCLFYWELEIPLPN